MRIDRTKLQKQMKGESVAQLRMENTVVDTPTPMITTTDVNYASELTDYEVDMRFPHKLHEVREIWSHKRLLGLSDPKKWADEINWLRQQMINSLAERFMYTPIFNNDVYIGKNTIMAVVKLQAETGINMVNVPYGPTLPNSDMENILKDCKRVIADVGQEPFLQFRCDYSEAMFLRGVSFAKTYQLSGITTMYADAARNFGNFKVLAELCEGNLVRHLSGIDRIWRKDKKSAITPYGMLFAETFSTKVGRGGSKRKKDGQIIKPKPRTNARRYDWTTSGHLRISEHRQEHGEELNCLCPIDNGNTMEDIIADYHNVLYPAFRTHEPYAMHTFADFARECMRSGTLKEFLSDKKYASGVLSGVFKIGQQELPDT